MFGSGCRLALLLFALPVGAPQESGTVPTSAPSPEPTFEDVVKLQKDVSARRPASDLERFRLSLLHAAAGNLEEAEKILGAVKSPNHRLAPYLELYVRRQLGDHREASKLLAQLVDEDRRATGFVIERAELCTKIRRFRDYDAADSDRVAPGGAILLYVEPRNFALRREGERHVMHLKYEWQLFDDRAAEVRVPAWDASSPEEREDRLTLSGPAAEFHQSFRLPLPADLAPGPYRVKVTVTDAVSSRSDRIYVPLTVGAEGGR